MSSFTFLLLCVQACLVQNVFSQGYGPIGYGAPPSYGMPGPYGVAPMGVELGGMGAGCAPIELGAYGGAGIGDVEVVGEMPVCGNTVVTGQVPILGAVRFTGDLPACGTVTVSGSCGCGCGHGPYYY